MTSCFWNDWFNIFPLLIPLFSFFSLFFSPPSLLFPFCFGCLRPWQYWVSIRHFVWLSFAKLFPILKFFSLYLLLQNKVEEDDLKADRITASPIKIIKMQPKKLKWTSPHLSFHLSWSSRRVSTKLVIYEFKGVCHVYWTFCIVSCILLRVCKPESATCSPHFWSSWKVNSLEWVINLLFIVLLSFRFDYWRHW